MKTTAVQLEDLRRLYWDEGLTLAAIGARFGVTRQAVAQLMQARGIARREQTVSPLGAVNRVRAAFARDRRADPPDPPLSEWKPLTLYAGGASITVLLPPRGPSGSRQNYERHALVAKASSDLHLALRLARPAR